MSIDVRGRSTGEGGEVNMIGCGPVVVEDESDVGVFERGVLPQKKI